MDIIIWIQEWYKGQCDGDWEHLYGVKIINIDNPGWSVTIDLLDTNLEEEKFEKIKYDNGDDDWLICKVESERFEGRGDINKLIEILTIFKNWVESSTKLNNMI